MDDLFSAYSVKAPVDLVQSSENGMGAGGNGKRKLMEVNEIGGGLTSSGSGSKRVMSSPVVFDAQGNAVTPADISPALQRYHARADAGKIVYTYNGDLSPVVEYYPDLSVELYPQAVLTPYRHMDNSIKLRQEALQARFRYYSQLLQKSGVIVTDREGEGGGKEQGGGGGYLLEELRLKSNPSWTIVHVSKQQIQNDGDESLWMVMDANGEMLPLMFHPNNGGGGPQSLSLSLLHGTIVALKGLIVRSGGRGEALLVSDCCRGHLPPRVTSRAKQLLTLQKPKPLGVLMAAGPFALWEPSPVDSTDSSGTSPHAHAHHLDFAPLRALKRRLHDAEDNRPSAVVLLGPFVPEAAAEVIPSTRLVKMIEQELRGFIPAQNGEGGDTGKSMALMLIPSSSDTWHDAVVPQPPYEKLSRQHHHTSAAGSTATAEDQDPAVPSASCMPNPVMLSLHDVTMGLSTVDVLKHAEEISIAPTEDRITRLCSHLLQQRSFYPIWPPAPGSLVNPNKRKELSLTKSPHIMVLRSELQHFVKVTHDCVFLNPGRLCRGTSGGTYAYLTLHPLSASSLEGLDDAKVDHAIQDRLRVDIIRI